MALDRFKRERIVRDLDGLSRFENGVYKVLAYLIIFLAPATAVVVADAFLLRGLPPLFRYPLWIVAAIVGIVVGIGISGEIEDRFRALRKFLGRKTLQETEAKVVEKQREEAKHIEQWFKNLSETDQRWEVWKRLSELNEAISRINIQSLKTKMWLFWLFILIIAIALKVYG